MSKDVVTTNDGSNKTSSTVTKSKLGQGMMAGVIAGLSSIELPRMFNQLVIFLLDGSGSMSFSGISGKSKGYEVHQAVINVMERLKDSKNKSSFDVGFWAYANDTVQMYPIKAVKEYDLVKDCFNPFEFVTDHSSTLLHQSLRNANEQATEYLEKYKGQNTKVLIIILGDGAILDYSKCFSLKESASNNESIILSSILFESTNWHEGVDMETVNKLKLEFSKLASSQADYMSTVDAEKIRSHMIQSITKISKI